MAIGWQVGIDVGGTFTDVVALHGASNDVRTAKVPTDLTDRVEGLKAALTAVGLRWDEVDDLVHGTTMVTNAIVEDELADVALVTTQGFADTLAIGRQNRRHLYHLDLIPKAAPQVRAEHRFEVSERMNHRGNTLKELCPESVDQIVEAVRLSGVKTVAVCLLHAYANPKHEEELGRRLAEVCDHVALSHRVNPEAREYERTATTVLSASVMPLAASYLARLDAAKPDGSRLHLFHSAGGMASPSALRDLPLGLAMSGPAAGVAAASNIANALNLDHVLSFDMGGTTTDVCLITEGYAEISSNRSLGERPLRQPMVAVDSIGAGGGSIARLDHGALCVGPQSAGAFPGPACYGHGGTQATVSDANIVLGYLDSERVLGNNLKLDIEAARKAMAPLAEAMNISIEDTALGINRVAGAAMVRALRKITVERGIDGRNCALMAFGGAGPMHAVDVARAFGISTVVVPAFSSVFSALGCTRAEMSYSQQQTVQMPLAEWDQDRLNDVCTTLQSRLSENLINAGYSTNELSTEEVAAVRYSGQSYAIEIRVDNLSDPAALGRMFYEHHQRLYGFAPLEPWELVTVRQRVFAPRHTVDASETKPAHADDAITKTTQCWFAGTGGIKTPRYNRDKLVAGQEISGPAIIEDACSTVILPPKANLNVDGNGNLIIEVGDAR